MVGRVTGQVRGAKEVAQLLRRLPTDLAARGLDTGVRGGIRKWQAAAKRLAPIWLGAPPELDPGPHRVGRKKGGRSQMVTPGNLRRNIKIAKVRSPSQLKGIESRYGLYIQAIAYYWRFVELGTSKMAAKPFLRPTFDSLAPQTIVEVAGVTSGWIDRYLRSQGKAA